MTRSGGGGGTEAMCPIYVTHLAQPNHRAPYIFSPINCHLVREVWLSRVVMYRIAAESLSCNLKKKI